MPKRNYIEQLEKLGYTVGHPMANTLWVEGFGVATYVPEDDTEALDTLIDQSAHEERKRQMRESPEETRKRLSPERKGQ